MTFRNTLAVLLTSAALTMGFAGCGDDKEDNTNQPTTQDPITDPKPDDPSVEPCKGDECSAKQQDAENKMASCDFAQAYEDINAIYAAQVKDNKLDAQTALDRSILGLIHILYREDVQAILPKLGFIAKSGLVDFKPLWQADNGIFKQVFTGNHNYDGYGDLIPMTIAKDDDKAWEDTIDKSLTFDNVLDVLVNLYCENTTGQRKTCVIVLDDKGNPTDDECKTEFSLDYKTLFCGEHSDDDEPYLECVVPGDTDDEKKLEKYANMILPNLFKATVSKRQVAGTGGVSAFKKAASLYLQAIDGSAKGAFFDFSKIPAGALQDMKDIAKEMADGTGSLAKFIKPGLTVDLNKVFKDVLFAADNEFQKDPTANNDIETYGDDWIGDFISSIYGDEVFLNEKLPNYILNTDLISHEIYYSDGIRYIELDFKANDKYDATFSSAWDDLNLGHWLNPHYYFHNA